MATTTRPFSTEQQWEFETPAIGGIVVGFDGSPASHSAIETAAAIAVVVQSVILNGFPVTAITRFCQQVGADLLAVGTRRLSVRARAVLGSVSVGLARKLNIPVLIAPARPN